MVLDAGAVDVALVSGVDAELAIWSKPPDCPGFTAFTFGFMAGVLVPTNPVMLASGLVLSGIPSCGAPGPLIAVLAVS